MKEPTETEIREFWEWCGFRSQVLKDLKPLYRYEANLRWVSPLGKIVELPSIDLNNLFKYVPQKMTPVLWRTILRIWIADVIGDYKKDTMALFWAISDEVGS